MPPLQQTHLINKLISRILKFKQIGKAAPEALNAPTEEINEFIMFSCIDKRLDPINMVKVPLGKMYVVRNPGNIVPNHEHHNFNEISSEAGAIELAVKMDGIQDIVICGHSDCKAMHLLMHKAKPGFRYDHSSPLNSWVDKFTVETWTKFESLMQDRAAPLHFQLRPLPLPKNRAFICSHIPEVDCLSQINTLQQVENIAQFPFLQQELLHGGLCVYGLWEYLGEKGDENCLYLFDKAEERFLMISEKFSDRFIRDFEE